MKEMIESNLFETDAEDVARAFRRDARMAIAKLQDWVAEVAKELDRHERGAFCRQWVNGIEDRVRAVACAIDRANGAVLVRGKEK